MTDRPTPLGERPVLAGLLALTGVAVVVGLLAGLTLLTGTKILGIGGGDGSAAAGQASTGETLYLPDPVETTGPDGPLITLDVDPTPTPAAGDEDDEEASEEEKEAERKKREADREKIKLTAGQTAVAPMQRIDLTGTYPAGTGAILQVQRFENGAWANFPVTVSVTDGAFGTYVVTGQGGETRFRVLDTDSGKASNAVTVTIG
ncbi:hypothetical protein [Nocardioides jishulii]|uniref:Uncharacterized protein n=1 Tax=Nocardioides jishulii TaxID=2575440 RepID=A0A4U2YSA9_9ACTN|nr:hypothetical protein [Nocardioides jishulii]QCX26351.1 hypothetical protein FCL41_01430 [Nocardioides jishulii]TKI63844.1 hypothetical protein FC770_01275 [Nocardioides jishulii]